MNTKRAQIAFTVVVVVLLAVFVVGALGGCEEQEPEALPTPTEAFFVNDFAQVLTEADAQAVAQAGEALATATKAQIVLVTVENTGNRTLEEYSLAIARDWALGDADLDNGVLLLFTTEGPHSRIEVGYGLEGALPDSKAGRILDTYLVPVYEDPASWSAGLTATYTALINAAYAEYGLADSQLPLETPEEAGEDVGPAELMMLLPILLVLVFVIFGMRRGLVHVGPGGFGGGYHRGGFGGGFHGGGGGFRGGGGGFGGGGASR